MSRSRGLVLAAFLALCWLPSGALMAQEVNPSMAVDAAARQAIESLNAGKYKQATRRCERASGLTSQDSTLCLLVQSIGYNQAGEPAKAVVTARELVAKPLKPAYLGIAHRELGLGLRSLVGDRQAKRAEKELLGWLQEAESALRQSLELIEDLDGQIGLALADVLLAEMIHEQDWENDQEVRALATSYLADHPSGAAADWAREAACLSKRYLDDEGKSILDETRLEIPTVGQIDSPPKRLQMSHAQYTSRARQARLEGVVILQGIVDVDGKMKSIEVKKGLPLCLTEEAVLAAKATRWRPALADGEPVAVHYNSAVNLRLQ